MKVYTTTTHCFPPPLTPLPPHFYCFPLPPPPPIHFFCLLSDITNTFLLFSSTTTNIAFLLFSHHYHISIIFHPPAPPQVTKALYIVPLSYLYDPSMYGGRNVISCLLTYVLYCVVCIEGEFEPIIPKIRLSIKDKNN